LEFYIVKITIKNPNIILIPGLECGISVLMSNIKWRALNTNKTTLKENKLQWKL